MRLWSLHPQYLDVKGLTACWREGLLAKAVLDNQTRGYLHHPQLMRFRQHPQPLTAINYFLEQLLREADKRGYHFDHSKIVTGLDPQKIPVTCGQLEFELKHLKHKLITRDPARLEELTGISQIEANPLFYVINGGTEPWEKI
jgi:hypothetical protein